MQIKMVITFSSVVLLLAILAACSDFYFARDSARFYEGPPLPIERVALFGVHKNCLIVAVRQGSQEKELAFPMYSGELMPVRYQLAVRYAKQYGYEDQWASRSKSSVYVEIDAQAGHTYFIYPTFPSQTTWEPKVIDIENDEDYLKIEDPSDRELLKRRIADYLSRGERWPLMHSTETPGYWEARPK